jgi:hypothetical protein
LKGVLLPVMLNRLRAHLLERIDRLSEGWQRFVGNHPRLIHTLKKTYIERKVMPFIEKII